MRHSKELSDRQVRILDTHLAPAVERMIGSNPKVPTREEIKKELDKKHHDYEGGSYVVMEELEVSKVVECWPSSDEAAVAPLEDFLKGASVGTNVPHLAA